MHLKISSVKWRPFCPGFNVLRQYLPAAIAFESIPAKVTGIQQLLRFDTEQITITKCPMPAPVPTVYPHVDNMESEKMQ